MTTTPNLGLYLPDNGDGATNGKPWGTQVNANFSTLDHSLVAAAGVNPVLPAPIPGYMLGWDGTGTGLSNFVAGTGTGVQLQADLASTASAALGDALIGVKQPFTGAVATTQDEYNGRMLNALDYAVVCDGITDNTAKIQLAVNDAHASAATKTVYVPWGCKFLLENLTMYQDIILRSDTNRYDKSGGSWHASVDTVMGSGDAEFRISMAKVTGQAATNAPYLVLINRYNDGDGYDKTVGIVSRYGTDAAPYNTWQLSFGRYVGTTGSGTHNHDIVLYSYRGGQKNRLCIGGNSGSGGAFIFNPDSTSHFDPSVELGTNHNDYVFCQSQDAGASDDMGVLFFATKAGAINLDMRAGSDSYRNRFNRANGSNILKLKGNDLATDIMTWNCDPTSKAVTMAGNVGFNGAAALSKPSITGSRAGNAALASLLTALANYGLITDSTTA